jgi:hypothetical protein
MKIRFAVLALACFAAAPAMACYTVYDRTNTVVYNAQVPPVDMTKPLREALDEPLARRPHGVRQRVRVPAPERRAAPDPAGLHHRPLAAADRRGHRQSHGPAAHQARQWRGRDRRPARLACAPAWWSPSPVQPPPPTPWAPAPRPRAPAPRPSSPKSASLRRRSRSSRTVADAGSGRPAAKDAKNSQRTRKELQRVSFGLSPRCRLRRSPFDHRLRRPNRHGTSIALLMPMRGPVDDGSSIRRGPAPGTANGPGGGRSGRA